MNHYMTCEHCGVVLDTESSVLGREDRNNHDGDKICEHIQCPVCKEWSLNPYATWRDI